MSSAPSSTLLHGISLVQSGRRTEALPYLRYAARSEGLTADGWLWLAAATDDLDEYRACVVEALRQDPYHAIAGRMQQALERQQWQLPRAPLPAAASVGASEYTRQDTAWRSRPSWLRRALRVLVLALLIGGCLGVFSSLIVTGAIPGLVQDWLRVEKLNTLDFTIGETPAYHFRVQVPESWRPANTDNPSWRATRGELVAALPGSAVLWESLEVSYSVVVRDEVYGTIMPRVHLVETDVDRLRAGGLVAALTLREIVPLPDPPAGGDQSVCARMRLLETQALTGEVLSETPGGSVIAAGLEPRADLGDCSVAVQRRFETLPANQAAFAVPGLEPPSATREIVLAVPAGPERTAIWVITLPEARYDDDYAYAVEQILATLEFQP